MVETKQSIEIAGFRATYESEPGILVVKMPQDLAFDEDEAQKILKKIMELCEGGDRNGFIIDIRENKSKRPSREFRNWIREQREVLGFERTAVLVTSPVGRMFAKVIGSVTGLAKKTRFFKREEDARQWLIHETDLGVGDGTSRKIR